MAKISEARFQTVLVQNLRLLGAVVLVKVGNHLEGVGWPDLYVLHGGENFWIELKVDGGKRSKVQLARMKSILEQGGFAAVVRYSNKLERVGCDATRWSHEAARIAKADAEKKWVVELLKEMKEWSRMWREGGATIWAEGEARLELKPGEGEDGVGSARWRTKGRGWSGEGKFTRSGGTRDTELTRKTTRGQ